MISKLIPIGSDHAGFQLKNQVIDYLIANGFDIRDFGCFSEDSIDYPDFGHPVAKLVEENEGMLGILICGSGNGINMTANKHQGIRSALCWKKEIAELRKEINVTSIRTIRHDAADDEFFPLEAIML